MGSPNYADMNDLFNFFDEFDGGSIYKYVSANPNAISDDTFFDNGQTFAMKVAGASTAIPSVRLPGSNHRRSTINSVTGLPVGTKLTSPDNDRDRY